MQSVFDNCALDNIYRDNHNWLRGLLYRRLGCSETAADLAHDTFLKLINKPRDINNITNARSYLRTVAERICIDHWRRKSIENAWLECLANRDTPYAPSEEQNIIIIETLFQIDTMLSSLPDKISKAFELSLIDGLTYKQIASQLNVSERTVKTYMARAMFECMQIELALKA